MGPNKQNQHFAELRQKGMFIYTRGSAQKEVCQVWKENLNVLSQKNGKSCLPSFSQTDYKVLGDMCCPSHIPLQQSEFFFIVLFITVVIPTP